MMSLALGLAQLVHHRVSFFRAFGDVRFRRPPPPLRAIGKLTFASRSVMGPLSAFSRCWDAFPLASISAKSASRIALSSVRLSHCEQIQSSVATNSRARRLALQKLHFSSLPRSSSAMEFVWV
jgi:hypothetical protein